MTKVNGNHMGEWTFVTIAEALRPSKKVFSSHSLLDLHTLF